MIDVQHHTNPNSRTFHCDFTICPDGRRLTSDLHGTVSAIRGVETLESHRYYLRIVKGRLFSWDDIEPRIIEALTTYNDRRQSMITPRKAEPARTMQ